MHQPDDGLINPKHVGIYSEKMQVMFWLKIYYLLILSLQTQWEVFSQVNAKWISRLFVLPIQLKLNGAKHCFMTQLLLWHQSENAQNCFKFTNGRQTLFYINSRIQMLALNSCNQHMNHAGHHLFIHLNIDDIFHVTRSTYAPTPHPLPSKSVQNV